VVSGTTVAAYAVTTGGVTMISGASASAQAIDAGAARVVATDDAQTPPGIVAVACRVRRISWVSAPAGMAGGGVLSLGDGGAANPSSSDELETTIHHLWGERERRCSPVALLDGTIPPSSFSSGMAPR